MIIRSAEQRAERLVQVLDQGIDRAAGIIANGTDREAMSALRAIGNLAVVALERQERKEQLAAMPGLVTEAGVRTDLVRSRLAAIKARHNPEEAPSRPPAAPPWDETMPPGPVHPDPHLQRLAAISAVDSVAAVDIWARQLEAAGSGSMSPAAGWKVRPTIIDGTVQEPPAPVQLPDGTPVRRPPARPRRQPAPVDIPERLPPGLTRRTIRPVTAAEIGGRRGRH